MPVPNLAVASEADLNSGGEYDAVIVVTTTASEASVSPAIDAAIASAAGVDASLNKDPAVLIPVEGAAGGRVIVANAGPLNRDYDDVRMVSDAACAGVTRAIAAGSTKPILVLASTIAARATSDPSLYGESALAGVLGALSATYVPIQAREAAEGGAGGGEASGRGASEVVEAIGVLGQGVLGDGLESKLVRASGIEQGRRVARDFTGGDPERMAPPRAAEYFAETVGSLPNVTMEVEDDFDKILRDYPALGSVSRADRRVPRHHPRVVKLVYAHPEDDEATAKQLILVGKGVTQDTGGVDVKVGGAMVGMKKDCGGAAAAAGIVASCGHLQPRGIRVTAYLALVRNSVGAEAYTCDEVITTRSGARVLVINTDAEGRMAMCSLLCRAREEYLAARAAGKASEDVDVHTLATLTGHAFLAFGAYGALCPNGPAARAGSDARIYEAGMRVGDPFERSSIRREDWKMIAPKGPHYDVLQCNAAPSSRTQRGHQFPAVFLIRASGLERHGIDSETPIRYTHLDIAGAVASVDYYSGKESGAPVAALVQTYLKEE